MTSTYTQQRKAKLIVNYYRAKKKYYRAMNQYWVKIVNLNKEWLVRDHLCQRFKFATEL